MVCVKGRSGIETETPESRKKRIMDEAVRDYGRLLKAESALKASQDKNRQLQGMIDRLEHQLKGLKDKKAAMTSLRKSATILFQRMDTFERMTRILLDMEPKEDRPDLDDYEDYE